MMLKLILIFLVLSFNLHANSLHRGTIQHIDVAENSNELTHLYMSDGYVLKIKQDDFKSLSLYEEARDRKLELEIYTDSDRGVISVTALQSTSLSEELTKENFSYEPTILGSSNEAKKIFNTLRRGSTPWSQCYNRAHIWAYESQQKHKLDSMKVFMFYTRKYIREYNFKWWFHVAPFAYVRENGEKTEQVLDPEFTRGPESMQSWTDIFMKNKVNCPEISKYSEYETNQDSQYCYLYKTSMFYLQPLDLDNLERNGTTKSQWLNFEVKRAYRNGFGV